VRKIEKIVHANARLAQKACDCKDHQYQNQPQFFGQHPRMSARMIRGLHQKQNYLHFLLNPKARV
jgi:hypothetical protein